MPVLLAAATRIASTGVAGFLALALGAGCFFDGGESRQGGGAWGDFPNPQANTCGEITPGQMRRADTLVALARRRFDGEIDFLLGDSAARWSVLRRRDLGGLRDRYAAALEAAPNHCGALFGHAVTQALAVVEDPLLDSLVREADAAGAFGGMAALAKMALGPALAEAGATGTGPGGKASAGGGARELALFRRGLAAADKSLLTLFREAGERALLPRLDTALAALERVHANGRFAFEVGVDGRPTRLDRGEVGPLLAGLHTLRAALYLAVGYEWRVDNDESHLHLAVLRDIRPADFDSLTEAQRAALDHYTALLRRGHRFTRVRPGWEARVASIPSELLLAVERAQEGLRHGIRQAETGEDQGRDLNVVGPGEGADVDPEDLRRGVEHLERAKRYLRGEAPLVFSAGRDTLRVDFPRLFRADGLQAFLPRFRFHPYAMWNDTVVTEFGDEILGPIQFLDADSLPTWEGYEVLRADSLSRLAGRVVFPDPTFGGLLPGMTNESFWPTAQALLRERPRRPECRAGTAGSGGDCRRRLPAEPSDLDLIDHYFRALGL